MCFAPFRQCTAPHAAVYQCTAAIVDMVLILQDLFTDLTPAQVQPQPSAFNVAAPSSPHIPGMMHTHQMPQQMGAPVFSQFQRASSMVLPGQQFIQPGAVLPGQQPHIQGAYPPGAVYQAQLGVVPQHQISGYGVPQQGMMARGMMNGTRFGPQMVNGVVQPHMGGPSPQPGAPTFFQPASSQQHQHQQQQQQGGDTGLFRNLVDDMRSALPLKSQRSDALARMGSLTLSQSGYQSPTPSASGLGFMPPGVGGPVGAQGQPQMYNSPEPMMGQPGLLGVSPPGGFSTSGNPFA